MNSAINDSSTSPVAAAMSVIEQPDQSPPARSALRVLPPDEILPPPPLLDMTSRITASMRGKEIPIGSGPKHLNGLRNFCRNI